MTARVAVLLHGLLLAIALVPIFAVDVLPLFDYPNHLARMHVLLEYDRVPALRTYYEIAWAVLPNLAMEMVVLPLAQVMPLALAGKAFVALGLVAIAAGVVATSRVLAGRYTPVPFALYPVLYNDTFLFGFNAFLLGFGAALLLFAAWVGLRAAPPARRLLVAGPGALVLFFAHLLALGLFAVLVAAHEIGRAWRARQAPRRALADLALGALPFVVPIALFLAASPTAGEAGATTSFGLFEPATYVRKLGLFHDVFHAVSPAFDWAAFAVVVGGLAVGLATRRLAFLPGGLLPAAAVLLLFVGLPRLLFSSDYVDDRMAVVLILVVIATTGWRGAPRGVATGFAAAAALVFVARLGALASVWMAWQPDFRAYVAAFAALPEGARLTAAMGFCCDQWARRHPPLYHLPNLAVPVRNGFYASFFSFPGQQPVRLRQHYAADSRRMWPALTLPTAGHRDGADPRTADPYAREHLEGFDHIFVVNGDRFAVPPPPYLVPLATGRNFGLYRIEPAP